MTQDIVERLRSQFHLTQGDGLNALLATGDEAADLVEQLRAENERQATRIAELEAAEIAVLSELRELILAGDHDDCISVQTIACARIAGWNAAVEAAAEVAKWSAMVPPDGGCPTNEETAVADEAALRIRNLRLDQEGKDDE